MFEILFKNLPVIKAKWYFPSIQGIYPQIELFVYKAGFLCVALDVLELTL